MVRWIGFMSTCRFTFVFYCCLFFLFFLLSWYCNSIDFDLFYPHMNQVQETTLDRQQQVYERSYVRNLPSQPLQPYLTSRPVQSKYSLFPTMDMRTRATVPLIQQPIYDVERVFNPGNSFAPWSGYASNINRESELRNQIYAHQTCSQATYVPSSQSSLYHVQWHNQHVPQQPFPQLFQEQPVHTSHCIPHLDKMGFALFHNATRHQRLDCTD